MFHALRLLSGLLLLICLHSPALAQRGVDEGVLAGEKVATQARYEAVQRMFHAAPAPEDAAAFASLQVAGSLPALFYFAIPKAEICERAFDEYRGMLLDAPDALVRLAAEEPLTSARVSLSVRKLVAQQILSLPPSLATQYRRQIDVEARKLLAEGRDHRSPEPLQRIVRDYSISASAAEAFDLLGDLAFERGDFKRALDWWHHLADLPSEAAAARRAIALAVPDNPARIQAKQILALAFDGSILDANRELSAFRDRHPNEKGVLAGKSGLLADIVAEWLSVRAKHAQETLDRPWTTFAGDERRNGVLPATLPAGMWMDGPTWRAPLPKHAPVGMHPAERYLLQRHAPCHPLVTDGQVLIGDARSVTSYDLDTGERLFQFRILIGAKDEVPEKTPFAQRPRFTLSAGSGRVFARLGRLTIGPREPGEGTEKPGRTPPSVLACLDIASKPLPPDGRLLWQIDAKSPEGEPAFFEGAPIVGDNRVWILVSELKGLTTRMCLACYDFQGKRRWIHDLYDGSEFIEGRGDRARHHLLTRSGPNLIAVSHTGAVIAVDAESGAPAWGVRYPRLGAERDAITRELLPALACPGRVVVAPADSHAVFCLDADTGRVLWERENLLATQLLGVAENCVLLALPHGLTALDLDSGRTRWQQPAFGKLPSLGRGLIAGPWFLWPTHDPQLPCRAIHVSDGSPFQHEGVGYEPTQLRHLPAGNFAFGQGSLVIATPNEIVAYVAPKRLLPRLQAKAAANEATPADRYRLALAQTLTSQHPTAASSLDGVWRKVFVSRVSAPAPLPACVKEEIPPTSLERDKTSHSLSGEPRLLWKRSGWLTPVVAASGNPPQHVYRMEDDALLCIDPENGETRWRQGLRHPPVTWLGHHADTVLAAGPRGIDAFQATSGIPRWSLAAPESDAYRFDSDIPIREQPLRVFSDFAWQSGYLTFFLDRRRAYVLSPTTGKILHCEACRDADVRPLQGGRWQPFLDLTPSPKGMHVRLHEAEEDAPTIVRLDLTPTMRLIADESGVVSRFRPGDTHPMWTFTFPSRALLSGEWPQLVGSEDRILASFRTNLGPALFRLDPVTGRALWRFAPGTTPDLDGATLDAETLYVAKGNTTEALAISNGRSMWKQTLPAHIPRWRLEATSAGILVFPRTQELRPWLPLPPGLTSAWTLHHSVRSPREFPVLLLDRTTGRTLWDLRFDGHGGPGYVQLQGERLFVSTAGQTYAFRTDVPK